MDLPAGASFCDRLCFPSATSALRERQARQQASQERIPLLSVVTALRATRGRSTALAREPTRGDVLALAWPHVNWLVWGCLALACRLPFSVAMPHFVSAVIGAGTNSH